MVQENLETQDNRRFTRRDNNANIAIMFQTIGSAGKNNPELARILTTLHSLINIFGWEDKPLAKVLEHATQYQASIDSAYHNDAKEVMIAEEVERRRENRRGINIAPGQR